MWLIGLADGTDTERQGRQEEDPEAPLGKQAFPFLVELTAPLHAGSFSGPGAATVGQRNRVLMDSLQLITSTQEGLGWYTGLW